MAGRHGVTIRQVSEEDVAGIDLVTFESEVSMVAYRPHLATPALLAVLALAGCASGESGDTAPSASPSASATTSAGTPSPEASERLSAPTTIPVSAFFAMPEDMVAGDVRVHAEVEDALPRMCGNEFASSGATAASAAVQTAYKPGGAPQESIPSGVLYQTIRTYPGDGAASFMRRLRDDLEGCTSFRLEDIPFRVRTKPLTGVGDEAVAIDLIQPQTDLPGNPVGGEQVNRALVIRVGDTVTILWDAEYERSSSDPATVDQFARLAIKAIEAWRG